MALPVAHTAVALGMTRSRDPLVWVCLGLLSILPDLDFILVWGFGLPINVYHRTFSHSLLFGVTMALLWMAIRPGRLKAISPFLVFAVLLSHSFVDMLCTADVLDHGVVFFWPLSDYPMGWPALVPLYLSRDELFTWQMRTWARTMKTVNSEAYLYFFSRVPPRAESESLGSYHGAEIPYVFNNVEAMSWALEETDLQLSRMMSDYWLNFATSGDPNGEGLPPWAAYRLEEEPYMHFGGEVEPAGDGFLTREFDFFDRYFAWRRSR